MTELPDSANPLIRVAVVDDHTVVRRGLRAFLQTMGDVEVVGEAADGREALELLARAETLGGSPDVVLMDLQMPRLDGIEATKEIVQRYPSVRVVAMTSFSEPERVNAALAAGAAGYLLKDAEPGEVAQAIHAAYRGEVHIDPAVVRTLTRALVGPRNDSTALTDRERDIVILVAQGLNNREIAEELTISERTARSHVSNILLKLNLASRTQAALWAIREGLATVQ